MPSTSFEQAKLMSAIAHGWKPAGAAQKHLPTMAVAREFHEADKKVGKYMHYKGEGGKVGALREGLESLVNKYVPSAQQRLARAGSQLSTPGYDPYNSAEAIARRAAQAAESDKLMGGVAHPEQGWADGGKVGALVNFAKAGTKALMDRIEGAFHNPYTANTDQLRKDVSKYWQTNAPAPVTAPVAAPAPKPQPTVQDLSNQLHDLVNKTDTTPKMADGGPVDQPLHRVRTYSQQTKPGGIKTDPLLLIRHAADRVSAAVTDDPHHMLARIAGGLTTQLAGTSPSGKAEFGRVPGLAAETKALPAGLIDLGKGMADLGGGVADAAQAHGYQSPGLAALQALRGGLNNLQNKYGDLAPSWSRKAEANADNLHEAVRNQMQLSSPRGFAENAAEAGGMMLGQVPIVGQEEKAASLASKLLKSPIEWLSPSVRPKAVNYGVGTLAGGAIGEGSEEEYHPQVEGNPMRDTESQRWNRMYGQEPQS
jgi:hypothetical protein